MNSDTIAAIATAMSNSGIGIIRISGKESINIVSNIYVDKNNTKVLNTYKTNTIHYGYIIENEEILDEVMVSVMKSPNSFTTEDTVEINCHGGILVINSILELVIRNGARLAQPGEFTKRAFLNGRIDLSEAEAVMDIISSENEIALKNSVRQLKGSVYNKITEIRNEIIYEIDFIESALDDPEHISLDDYPERLNLKMKDLIFKIDKLLSTTENWKIIKEGVNTVIVGKPNAGKSSLLNILAGEEKAIVTDIAGTTRDIIEENIRLHDINLHVIDTAGIRRAEDIIEKIGVEKAKKYTKEADLIINETIKIIKTSTKENTGIEDFEKAVKDLFLNGEININSDIMITNLRHKEVLKESLDSLVQVSKSILNNMPEDFYSIDLMSAYKSLGKIIGEEVEEDLVNEIFSKFCMGK